MTGRIPFFRPRGDLHLGELLGISDENRENGGSNQGSAWSRMADVRPTSHQHVVLPGHVVDLSSAELRSATGEHVILRPRTLGVLRILAEQAGCVVAKEEILSEVWDDVAVTEDSLTQCVVEIRKAIGDKDKSILRTVPRRGYVLVPSQRTTDFSAATRRPTLAVLPFGSLFDKSVQPLAAGVASELLNELARNRDIRIIGRASSFALGSQGLTAQELGRRLGARYLVEGTAQRSGEVLVVDVQLLDARDGLIVWGDRFETNANDIPRIQRDIATEIAASIRVTMQETEKHATLGRAPRDLDVYELTLRGISQHQITPEATLACRHDLEEAVRRDPNYAPAWTYLSWVNLIDIWVHLTGEWDRSRLDEVIEQFHRAIDLDPQLPNAYRGLAMAVTRKGDVEAGLSLARRAFELGPSEPDSFLFLGVALYEAGELAESTTMIERALDLHPLPPSYYPYFHAAVLWASEKYDEALRETDRSLEKAPHIVQAMLYRALALVGLGRLEEAREQISRYRARPSASVEVPLYPELASRFLDGLNAAGWQPPLEARQGAG